MQHNDRHWRKQCLHEAKTTDLLHSSPEGIAVRFLPRRIGFPSDALPFKQLEEAFSNSFVMTAASSTHARLQVVTGQEPLPLVVRKLAALVRMNEDGLAWFSAPDDHMQGFQGQLSINAAPGCPTNHLPREQVNHYC